MFRQNKLATWVFLALLHFAVAVAMLGLASQKWEHELFSATEHGERVLHFYDAVVWILLFPVLTFQRYLHGWMGTLALATNSVAYGGLATAIGMAVAKQVRRARGAG